MPSLFMIGSYRVFFWSNENDEPIHVHISKGKPAANATKIWITRSGHCVLADNRSRIPQRDLNDIMDILATMTDKVEEAWKVSFRVDVIKYRM